MLYNVLNQNVVSTHAVVPIQMESNVWHKCTPDHNLT